MEEHQKQQIGLELLRISLSIAPPVSTAKELVERATELQKFIEDIKGR